MTKNIKTQKQIQKTRHTLKIIQLLSAYTSNCENILSITVDSDIKSTLQQLSSVRLTQKTLC